ncbi:hypothetical protein QUF80_09530 [Desulfococcaceae bacterium HSG8]|nr:hypothetical protein [Desulfococcaceae bacterium HSG8]
MNIFCSILDVSNTIQKKTDNDREDRITTRICARLNWIPAFRDGPLAIHPQQEIFSQDIDADHVAGRVDILVSCGRGSHVYFAIEAKRLRFHTPKGKFKTGNDEYVNAGMMRFVSGQYAPLMETGAMLGYVYDGETGKARSGVASYIRGKEKELRLRKPKRLMRSEILPDKNVDETNHDLGQRAFTIYHIFTGV